MVGSGSDVSYIGAYASQSSGTIMYSGCTLGDAVPKHVVVAFVADSTSAATVTIAGVTATVVPTAGAHQYAIAETAESTGNITITYNATVKWRCIGVFAVYGGMSYVSQFYGYGASPGSGKSGTVNVDQGGAVIALANDVLAKGTGAGSLSGVTDLQTVILPNNAFTDLYFKFGLAKSLNANAAYPVSSSVLYVLSIMSFK